MVPTMDPKAEKGVRVYIYIYIYIYIYYFFPKHPAGLLYFLYSACFRGLGVPAPPQTSGGLGTLGTLLASQVP
jgi:hypothetical protein